ncbi:MAG: hypothetical protein KBA40_01395 [Candidatus Peribacteraceae bacterium]|nr:hypothetical protein [Candidatus Peribacteraceae bacterium]MBP9850613.1 hypothetical protein [Candidatus Peribacteraceae bacterium]
MPRKTFDPSWNFSIAIIAIGATSLVCALFFSHALQNVRLAARAAELTCEGSLMLCLKSNEKAPECRECVASDSTILTDACQTCAATKARCQNHYNTCTGEGGKIHAW